MYVDILSESFNTAPPELHNTDGDLLKFYKLYCELTIDIEKALENYCHSHWKKALSHS